jgi:hypothetical protein
MLYQKHIININKNKNQAFKKKYTIKSQDQILAKDIRTYAINLLRIGKTIQQQAFRIIIFEPDGRLAFLYMYAMTYGRAVACARWSRNNGSTCTCHSQ